MSALINILKTALLLPIFIALTACGGGGSGETTTGTPAVLSTNANLIGLAVSVGSLNPAFNTATTSYDLGVVTDSSLSLTATLSDAKASFKINGNTGTSGISSSALALNLGNNLFDVVVTAEDGITTKTYTIIINRVAAANSNADLNALTSSTGALTPIFDGNTLNYTLNVANAINSTTLNATTAQAGATLKINGASENSGVDSANISLTVGANPIDVVVTASNGTTIKKYTVTVIRAGLTGSNADLTNLTITNTSLDQTFNSGVTLYTAATKFLITSVQLTPTSADSNAVITINNLVVTSGALSQPVYLAEGSNAINVKVTSADGLTVKTYTVTAIRETANNFAQKAYIKSDFQTAKAFGGALSGPYGTVSKGVVVDGNTLAISVIQDDAPDVTTVISGVYIFVRTDGVWAFQQRLTNNLVLEFFGSFIDLQGDTLAVGAPSAVRGTAPNYVVSGAVHIFTRNAGVWSLEQIIEPDTLVTGILFGASIAVEGNTIAIGAPWQLYTDGPFTSLAGAVYIFTRSGTTWSQQVMLTPNNLNIGDAFGHNLDLFNDTLVVSSPGERSDAKGINGDGSDNSIKDSGAVYVFKGAGPSWNQEAYIKSDVAITGYGKKLALYGNTLAVTSINEDKVYIYSNVSGSWTKDSEVQPNIAASFNQSFGSSIGLYKNTLIVGSVRQSSDATGINGNQAGTGKLGSGAAYVFARNGNSWTEEAFIKASNADAGDGFGNMVSIFEDNIAISAFKERSFATGINGDQYSFGFNEGAVYVFD